MKLRYVGPFPEIQIAATGEMVQQNHQVEVTAEVGRELIRQEGWERVSDKKKEEKE